MRETRYWISYRPTTLTNTLTIKINPSDYMFLPLFHLDIKSKDFCLNLYDPKKFHNLNLLFFGAFVAPFKRIFPLLLRFAVVNKVQILRNLSHPLFQLLNFFPLKKCARSSNSLKKRVKTGLKWGKLGEFGQNRG